MVLVRPTPDRKALRGTASLSNSQTLFFNISTFVNLAPLTSVVSIRVGPGRLFQYLFIYDSFTIPWRFIYDLFTFYWYYS